MGKINALFISALVLAFILCAAVAAAQGVSCGDTISSSETLTGDLNCSGNGLVIGADNITLDCDSHSITGDGSPGDGIDNAGYDNVTVKNCIISGFNNESSSNYNTGIHYYNEANNGSIINNTVNSNLEGIFLNSSSGNNITDNIANDNVYQGILLIGSNNNTITNNIAINSTTGIYLGSTSGCSYNTITYNNISNSSQNGISLDTNSNDNIIENNKVSYSSNAGIGLWSGSTSNIINFNQIYNNTNYDAYQENSGNDFTLNYWGGFLCNAKLSGITSTNDLAPYYMDEAMTALQNASFCCGETVTADYTLPADLSCSGTGLTIGAENITLDCAGKSITGNGGGNGIYSEKNNVTIKNCTIQSFSSGIRFYGGSNNKILNSTITSNAAYGIYLDSSQFGSIISNNVSSNLGSGIYLISSNFNNFTSNIVQGNTNDGIQLESSAYAILSNNTFTNNNQGIYITGGGSTNDTLRYNKVYSNSGYDLIGCGGCSGHNFTGNYWGGYLCNAKIHSSVDIGELLPYYTDSAMTTLDSGPLVCLCGTTIAENTTLAHDYICNGATQVSYALSVGANDVTLDCAGHSITGNGIGIGIKFSGVSGATIKNCEISGFAQGILSGNAPTGSNYILNNTIHDNSQYGIAIRQASDYAIADNQVSYSGVGIRIVSSSGNNIHNNTITNTTSGTGHGIDLIAGSGGDTFGNNIRNNTLESNNVSIYSEDSHDNVIDKNTIIGSLEKGIYLYKTDSSNITDNTIQNANVDGIYLFTEAAPLSDNLVQGNTISLSETDVAPLSKHGIVVEDDNNEIYDNTIDCASINSDYNNMGIWIRGTNIFVNAENNILLGNEVRNCYYGLSAWDVDYFEVDGDEYHNNTYGAYLQSAGSGSTAPLIENSRIYDNNHGVYLASGSYANISNTNFTNNSGGEGGPESGIHVGSGSTAYVTNGRFIDNGEYGIYDALLEEHVNWTINSETHALCRNNDAKINGSINFDGGVLELDNCTLFLNGAEINMAGNVTSLEQTQQEIPADTPQEMNFSSADSRITLNLGENMTVTMTVSAVTPTTTPSAALSALKGIDIVVDSTTSGALTWALIKIFYDEAELAAAGIDENTLKIYYYNTTSADWQLEPEQGVETTENYVWANVTHFSLFGAFGSGTTGGGSSRSDKKVFVATNATAPLLPAEQPPVPPASAAPGAEAQPAGEQEAAGQPIAGQPAQAAEEKITAPEAAAKKTRNNFVWLVTLSVLAAAGIIAIAYSKVLAKRKK